MSNRHLTKDDLQRLQAELSEGRSNVRAPLNGDAEKLLEQLLKKLEREGRS